MSTEKTAFISEQLKTGIVSIDSYEGKQMQGRLSYPFLDNSIEFTNVMQMLEAIQNVVSDLGYTQDYCKFRSFHMTPDSGEIGAGRKEAPEFSRGKLATFRVKIVFKQNASWQGIISWEETGREQNFRSVLEMLFLMDSALTERE